MAAHEQHDERVVLDRRPRSSAASSARDEALPVSSRPLAPPLVDQPPFGGLHQPAIRVLRDAVSRPVHGGREERLLDRVLGGVEVADTAGRARRGPAAPARAAGPRHRRHVQRRRSGAAGMRPSRPRWTERRPSPGAPGSAAGVATPPGPGTAEIFAGDLDRTLLRLDVDDLVAGEPLLELLERPVGDHGRGGAVGRDDLGQVGRRPGPRTRRARRWRPAPGAGRGSSPGGP